MPPIALKIDDVYAKVNEINRLWKKVKAESETPSGCLVGNSEYESARISSDALLREINADKMKEAQSNPYLEEAIDIITDWNVEEN